MIPLGMEMVMTRSWEKFDRTRRLGLPDLLDPGLRLCFRRCEIDVSRQDLLRRAVAGRDHRPASTGTRAGSPGGPEIAAFIGINPGC